MDEWDEIVAEFVEETTTNLTQMKTDLSLLAKEPENHESLAQTHRTFHSLKGLTGFLEFGQMAQLAQLGEALLHDLLHGERRYDAESGAVLANVRLALVVLVGDVAKTGEERPRELSHIVNSLEALRA